ncbi:MAG: cupredoxin domain-containing protein [Acidobacteriota bacterium]
MRKLTMIILISAVVISAGLPASAGLGAIKNRTAVVNAPANATVKITSFKFEPKVLTLKAGTTVEWVNDGGRHTVEADDGSFKSNVLKQGEKFEHAFAKPGKYPYHCEFHGAKGGKEMAGTIVVTK